MYFRTFLLILFSLNLASCAYRLGSNERSLPGGARTLAVPIFKNMTQEPGIEQSFTNSLIQQFKRSHVASVLPESMADVVVTGEINSISYVPAGKRTSADLALLPEGAVLATEYRILISATLAVVKNADKSVLWSGTFSGERTYSGPQVASPVVNSVNPLYNLSSRRQNIEAMALDMMTEAHDRITENF